MNISVSFYAVVSYIVKKGKKKMEGLLVILIYSVAAFVVGNRFMAGRIPALEGPGVGKFIARNAIGFAVGYVATCLIVLKWIFTAIFSFVR